MRAPSQHVCSDVHRSAYSTCGVRHELPSSRRTSPPHPLEPAAEIDAHLVGTGVNRKLTGLVIPLRRFDRAPWEFHVRDGILVLLPRFSSEIVPNEALNGVVPGGDLRLAVWPGND